MVEIYLYDLANFLYSGANIPTLEVFDMKTNLNRRSLALFQSNDGIK